MLLKTIKMDNWKFNEYKHCGVDYSKEDIAADYDNQHLNFRDYKKEAQDLVNDLETENLSNAIAIDLACGTGAFTINLSNHVQKVFAVDISKSMTAQAQNQANKHKISNIEFINSGFLSYTHEGISADLLITKYAFHHLPDFWKQIALYNINQMLKMGGIFYLQDIVYHFEPTKYKEKINRWIEDMGQISNPEMKNEIVTHIRDEFSTYDWIIQRLIKEAGFEITKVKLSDGFNTEYFCKKIKNITISD